MNILILSWRGPGHPYAGGAEESTHQHAKGWIKAGYDVTLFTSYYPGAKVEEITDGVKIIRQGSQNFGVHFKAFFWYVFKHHHKYDLIIDQFHGIPFFTPLYIKEKKLAFIHEIAKEVWSLNPWHWPFNLIPYLVGSIFEPLVFKMFYKKVPFITVSKSTKRGLMQWGIPGENITVIYNGIEKTEFKNNVVKEKEKTVIYLGTLSEDKGIKDAVETFSVLSQQYNDMQFWIVGKGESGYRKELELLVDKLRINRKVKFWGYVSNEKKFELLARAHVLINPSVCEGWGLVVIEAASVGTPTVAYNVSGLRDSIINGETGILSNERNFESLATEISKLLENKERYGKISRNAIIWSKKFSWEKAAGMSISLIDRIMENSNQ